MTNNSTEYGYLVLADISGYNAYVAGTEFDHAQEIIGDLLEFLVDRLRPLLTLVQIEGDAVFAFTPEKSILRGETLFELIEHTYVAFKNRLTSIKRHHTCNCAACQNVNALDLKFFVHFGEYIEQNIDDHHGLLGYAPLFVRKREWKEPVADSAGWHGYALFTEAALSKLNLEPDDLQAVEFSSSPIKTYGLNLQARYELLQKTNRVALSPEKADAGLRSEFDAPPPVIWEWLNDPQKRNLWWESYTRWTKRLRPGGRTGPGAVNHCNHGIGDMLETILDWRPFDYYTVEMRITPGRFVLLQTTYLEALPDGKTGIKIYYQLQNPRLRWMARAFSKFVAWFLNIELKRLKHLLEN
ncbi:MAG: DUF2652 domain-containing protein [Anaerolineales bacterium]|nr:DUF2652 domain-containing protein [Anaerolineales bacterium]